MNNEQSTISVIVSSYHTTLEALLCTLESVITQKNIIFDIIIADDGSEKQFSEELRSYFKQRDFTNYYIVEATENVGTVRNLLRALTHAKGTYIKGIGAGDCLYDEYALADIVSFMDQNRYKIGFGLIQGFQKKESSLTPFIWHSPKDISPYRSENMKALRYNMVVYEDYISGSCLFYEKEYFKKQLRAIEGTVIYCEDFLQVLTTLEHEKIGFLDRFVIYYEVGTGISTKRVMKKLDNRVTADTVNLNLYLKNNYSDDLVTERLRKRAVIDGMAAKIYYGFKNLPFYIRKTIYKKKDKPEHADLNFLESATNRAASICETLPSACSPKESTTL